MMTLASLSYLMPAVEVVTGVEKYQNVKDYNDTFSAAANDGKPLIPLKVEERYVIICTHSHYDHIRDLKHFQTASTCILRG